MGRRALQIRDYTIEFQNAISSTERCPVPVIIAVHGIAYGLPIDVMGACDVRYASSDATFSIKVSANLYLYLVPFLFYFIMNLSSFCC